MQFNHNYNLYFKLTRQNRLNSGKIEIPSFPNSFLSKRIVCFKVSPLSAHPPFLKPVTRVDRAVLLFSVSRHVALLFYHVNVCGFWKEFNCKSSKQMVAISMLLIWVCDYTKLMSNVVNVNVAEWCKQSNGFAYICDDMTSRSFHTDNTVPDSHQFRAHTMEVTNVLWEKWNTQAFKLWSNIPKVA